MTRVGKAGEFSPCERMFVYHLNLVVVKFPIIRKKFMKMCGKMAPYRSAMKAMAKKIKTKFSVRDQRMRRCGNLANEHSLTRGEFTSLSSPGHLLKQVQNASSQIYLSYFLHQITIIKISIMFWFLILVSKIFVQSNIERQMYNKHKICA